jgi:UDPglucose--hexose-1-phosphate uridylyltransferase
MENINKWINQIISYGINKGFAGPLDAVYYSNKLADLCKLSAFRYEEVECTNLEETLKSICDYAFENGLIEKTFSDYDIFENRVLDIIMPRPSEVIQKFKGLMNNSIQDATDYYYNLSKDSNYIKTKSIARNKVWKSQTKSGLLDITINLSKPEKDPAEIAAAKLRKSSGYPKCLLCAENEGFSGHISHPSRITHRIIPIKLNNKEWFLQYSPYSYFNEHSIVLSKEHTPMEVNRDSFVELLEFVSTFEHYFIGSNADLPIVGGSILSHDHYQSGNYTLPMENAKTIETFKSDTFDVNLLEWPMSALRVVGTDINKIADFAEKTLKAWIDYSNEELSILAHTSERHNTITPIARRRDGKYELDLVLRNNRTTDEHPMGIFHPHQDIHHIKKENIGLIEVMGLAVLPARLDQELTLIKAYLKGDKELIQQLEIHSDWIKTLEQIQTDDLDKMIEDQVALKFERCLIDAGVFKQDEKGQTAFKAFVEGLI